MEVAVEDHDPREAFPDEAVDDGPGAAAGPQHHRLAGHLGAPDELVERSGKPRHIGVVADQAATLAGDGVDRSRDLGLFRQAVDHGHDPFLVGDRDVRPQDVVRSQLRNGLGQDDRRPIPELVAGIDALGVEGGLLHRARQRMRDGVADEDDPFGHDRILSSSAKKPGYEMSALAGRPTVVRPVAMRPAMAKVIARR